MRVDPPTVSVVMAVYNCLEYLPESVGSILRQTYRDFEFIIVDDGSTDGSGEWLSEAAAGDDRINLMRQDNQGLTKSLNFALKHARGEYIARMDADDISGPRRLELQVAFMDSNHDIGVCGVRAKAFTSNQAPKDGKIIDYPSTDAQIKSTLFFYCPFIHPSVMIRASALTKLEKPVYNDDIVVAQDYFLWARLASMTSFANLEDDEFFYRRHTNQMTTSQSPTLTAEIVQIWNYLLRQIRLDRLDVDISTHKKVLLKGPVSLIDAREIKEWLEQLQEAGHGSSFLLRESWDAKLGQFWFKVCQRIEPKTISSWMLYRESPLARCFRSRREKMKLLLKCLLGATSH